MKLENFIVVGISYIEYDTEKREKFLQKNPVKFIENLKKNKYIEGYISLTTCLRVEFYIDLGRNSLKDFFNTTKVKEFFNEEKIFFKSGKEAVEYLFKVSCGFYSIIKGEDQILAQIKKSYLDSLELKTTTSLLNVIFNKGIELGKSFRTESKISHNALSLEAISLKFIKDSIDILENKKILILGIGDLAQSILHLLIKENIKNITITNRTEHKALEIKNIYKDINVINFNKKNEVVIESDIIISVTSAPHLVLKKEELENKIKTNKKYIFLDLAVPKDIDPQLSKLQNIDLFNLDDVWNVYNRNVKNRENILEKFEFLIYEQIEKLEKWFQWKEKMETD